MHVCVISKDSKFTVKVGFHLITARNGVCLEVVTISSSNVGCISHNYAFVVLFHVLVSLWCSIKAISVDKSHEFRKLLTFQNQIH